MPLPSLHAPGLDSSVHLDSEDLLGRLRELDPGVVLVPRRIMRRVLTADAERGGAAAGGIWHVPHSHCWAIRGEIGLQIVTREELELPLEVPTPDWLFLLARPEPEELRALPVEQALRHFRRLLFHAKVHARLRDRIDTGRFTTADLRDRIELVGRPAFEEIRQVLREDDLLLPPYDDATTFIEFAAVWLELRFFHPERLDVTFPGLSDPTPKPWRFRSSGTWRLKSCSDPPSFADFPWIPPPRRSGRQWVWTLCGSANQSETRPGTRP